MAMRAGQRPWTRRCANVIVANSNQHQATQQSDPERVDVVAPPQFVVFAADACSWHLAADFADFCFLVDRVPLMLRKLLHDLRRKSLPRLQPRCRAAQRRYRCPSQVATRLPFEKPTPWGVLMVIVFDTFPAQCARGIDAAADIRGNGGKENQRVEG
jgi:hypothetical protein